ncbi:MAG: hypothetical protein ACYST6_04615 [Planctomycetota bacterium]|jgi:ribose transport system substrate-binding protein
MKTKTLLLVSIAFSLLVNGCERKDRAADAERPERLFGVTFQTMNNPFFVDLNEGIKQVVEARGDRLATLDAQWDNHKQVDQTLASISPRSVVHCDSSS